MKFNANVTEVKEVDIPEEQLEYILAHNYPAAHLLKMALGAIERETGIGSDYRIDGAGTVEVYEDNGEHYSGYHKSACGTELLNTFKSKNKLLVYSLLELLGG